MENRQGMASHGKEVMRAELGPAPKRARRDRPAISFSDKDLEGIQLPHNDPLLLTMKLKDFTVKRILVDSDSSSEVLYYECFKKMKLGIAKLTPDEIPVPANSTNQIIHKFREEQYQLFNL